MRYPCCKKEYEYYYKKCSAAGRRSGKEKNSSSSPPTVLCAQLDPQTKDRINADRNYTKKDCAVCALRKKYFQPELELERQFQKTMKRRRKNGVMAKVFKPLASRMADKLLENYTIKEHEKAMDQLRQERIMKMDALYRNLERQKRF